MAKVPLNNIGSAYGAVGALNDNFNSIEEGFENTLSRDGSGPNQMEANLDMNGYDILNASVVYTDGLVLNGVNVEPSNAVAVATVQTFEFVATAGQTTFSVAPYAPLLASTMVVVNGVMLPQSSISVSSTNVVTPARTSGDVVVIRVFTRQVGGAPNASEVVYNTPGSTTRVVSSKLQESVSVKDFGAIGDGVADDTAALLAARNYIAAQANPPELVFPAGIYKYTVSPNWAITNARIRADGVVRLRYNGTGNAVILDAGPLNTDLIWNVHMGRFIVEGNFITSQNGVYVRSVHHSRLSFNVAGCGGGYSGIRVEFAVCTVFDDPTVSNNEGWYLGNPATYGMFLSQRLPGETASYCTFNNPVIEGCSSHGIWLDATLGNAFISGTSEGNYGWGVYTSASANNDKFYGTDFEVNTFGDLYIQGTALTFKDCDCTGYVYINGSYDRLDGGLYNTVELGVDAKGCSVEGITYYRFLGPPQPSPEFTTTAPSLSGSRILSMDTRGLLRGMAVVGTNIPNGTIIEGIAGESGCTVTAVRLSNTITGNISAGTAINFGYQTDKNTNLISNVGTSRLYFASTADLRVGMGLPIVTAGIAPNTYITAVSATYIDINNVLTSTIPSGTKVTIGLGVVGKFTDNGTYTNLDTVRNYNTTFNYLTARGTTVSPGTIPTLGNYTYTVTVEGTKVGDIANVSTSYTGGNLLVAGNVVAANTVRVILFNYTGSTITPGDIVYTNVVCKRPAIL